MNHYKLKNHLNHYKENFKKHYLNICNVLKHIVAYHSIS